MEFLKNHGKTWLADTVWYRENKKLLEMLIEVSHTDPKTERLLLAYL